MQSAPSTRNTQHATRQITLVAALLLIAAGFGLRLYQLAAESLWYDELLQLDIAQGLPPEIGGVASIFPGCGVTRLCRWITCSPTSGFCWAGMRVGLACRQ
ncbi:MAG: hypothetical protein HC875_39215 [Anaerolineales bacterium]|nr:hypothetical protein [Anaerolineales bacterium]